MTEHYRTRPIIGVVAAQYERKSGGIIAGAPMSYVRAVEAAGGIPLLIQLTNDQEILDTHYRHCDGLLFIGGGDIDPEQFGMDRHPACGAADLLRDRVELKLARRAIADGMPLCGICRGIQLLNVAMGGTLYQDIPSEMPGALDHYGSRHAEGRLQLPHSISIEPSSWLARKLGTTEIPVNSFHHQALLDVAPGLRVTALAADGVVEAVEGTDANFIVGVQCHPEDLWDHAEPRWAQLFAGFVAVARQAAIMR